MTVKPKPVFGIGCNSGIEEMLSYKAVNMGIFYIITVFFTNFPKNPKNSQKCFGDFFGKNTLRKYSFTLG